MRLVLDIEANGLENPDQIWLIVCKDIDTGEYHKFRGVTKNEEEKQKFSALLDGCELLVGHNLLDYDLVHIRRLLDISFDVRKTIDTLIVSRLVDYSRDCGHSLEGYGEEFGLEKKVFLKFTDPQLHNTNSLLFKQMEDYCVRDVEITHRIYDLYAGIINDPDWNSALSLEHHFQGVVNHLHRNGFSFNDRRARNLLDRVEKELSQLDEAILKEFPPREVLIREFTPKATKYGTISKSSVPRVLHDQIQDYVVGVTYRHTKLEPFNPSSHKQIVDVLSDAGWQPTDRTKTHIELERLLNPRSRNFNNLSELELSTHRAKLLQLKKYGWKINENNLSTLPEDAPQPARTLAKRILLESRRRTLTEWLALVNPISGRVHGKFIGIGAWTHRMAHQNPNTANIPTEAKLHGKEMRSLWQAPKGKLLVGVDAEGIQLRIFAHYIDDKEFTDALVRGRKEDKTDPHSLNQRIMGSVCKSRAIAKRFIYALLLGAGIGKLAEILGCSQAEAKEVLDRLLQRYAGFAYLKEKVIPADGRRGYFIGLDGRCVKLPADTEGSRRHLCMSGYLQNGEAIVMKKACLLWHKQIGEEFNELVYARSSDDCFDLFGVNRSPRPGHWRSAERFIPTSDSQIRIVNFVHDEWQTEVPNDMKVALRVAQIQSDSLRIVGEELGLKCPLAGSYWNDDHKDFTIGPTWATTH